MAVTIAGCIDSPNMTSSTSQDFREITIRHHAPLTEANPTAEEEDDRHTLKIRLRRRLPPTNQMR